MIFFNSLNDLFLNLTKTKEIIRNISIFLLLINSIINIYFYSKRNKENKFLNFTYNFLLIIELILVFILFYVDIKINEDLFNELAIDAFLFLLVCLFHDNDFLNKSKKKKLNETENVNTKLINSTEEEIKTKITKYKNNFKIIEVNNEKFYLVPYKSYFDYNNVKELKIRILNDMELCFNSFVNENYLEPIFSLLENEIDEKNDSVYWNSLKNKVLYVMILIATYIKREELINEKGKTMSEISKTDSLAISKKIQTLNIDFMIKYFTNFKQDIFERFLFFAGKIPSTCDKEIRGTDIKVENGLFFKYFNVDNELNKELIDLLKKQYPFDIEIIEKGLQPKIVGMIEEITTEYQEHALYGIVCNIEIELKKLVERYKK
jgi:hypothetical protein